MANYRPKTRYLLLLISSWNLSCVGQFVCITISFCVSAYLLRCQTYLLCPQQRCEVLWWMCLWVCVCPLAWLKKPHVQTSRYFLEKPHVQISRYFLYMLIVAVTRSFSEDNAMRCMLPFLWITNRPVTPCSGECSHPPPALCRHYTLFVSVVLTGGGGVHFPLRGVFGWSCCRRLSCCFFLSLSLAVVSLVVSISVINCLVRLLSEITFDVLIEALNVAYLLSPSETRNPSAHHSGKLLVIGEERTAALLLTTLT